MNPYIDKSLNRENEADTVTVEEAFPNFMPRNVEVPNQITDYNSSTFLACIWKSLLILILAGLVGSLIAFLAYIEIKNSNWSWSDEKRL